MEKPDTRNVLVNAMSECLQEYGYRSTSTTQVLTRTGISRGSLYFHFPGGKEALAAAAVEASGRAISGWIAAEFARGPGATARLFDGFAMLLEASQFTKGCPVALSALEAGEQEPVLKAAIREVYADWQQAIMTGLIAQGIKPDTAANLAQMSLIQIEGALLLARVNKSVEPLMLTKNSIIQAIGEIS
jgi:TetR/AcrR family transcriptional repressor of lmrAB and yxaGH operons